MTGNQGIFSAGLDGADRLPGTDGDDTLYGFDGHDNSPLSAVGTSEDNDTIYGGHGSDHLHGDLHDDLIFGGWGIADPNDDRDWLFGGYGNDTIYGNGGDDVLEGGGNSDWLYGGFGNDTIYGGSSDSAVLDGADIIFGSTGEDVIFGGAGNDTIYGGNSIADPNDGADTIRGGAGDDLIYGNGGNDWLEGGAGNDTLYGGFGTNTLTGGAGQDVFFINDRSITDAQGGEAVLNDPTAAFQARTFTVGENQTIVITDFDAADVIELNLPNNQIHFDDLTLGSGGENSNMRTIELPGSNTRIEVFLSGPNTGGLDRSNIVINGERETNPIILPTSGGGGGGAPAQEPVVVSPLPDLSLFGGDNLMLTGADYFEDPQEDDMTFSATLEDGSALPGWMSFDSTDGSFGGTPAFADRGDYEILLTAEDENGNETTTPFTVTVDNKAPETDAVLAHQAVEAEDPLSYVTNVGFSDPESDSITFSANVTGATSLPGWLSIDDVTGELSGTPNLADIGSYSIDVTATDSFGASHTQTITITVDPVVPVLDSAVPDASLSTGDTLNHSVAAHFSDPNGDVLTYSATLADGSALPGWLSLDTNTGVFSGTPGAGDRGTIDITVTVDDGDGHTLDHDFSIDVNNHAPTIASLIADQTHVNGDVMSLDTSAAFTDIESDVLTYSATLSDGSALPGWLSIDSATGVMSGNVLAVHRGDYEITVTATDSFGDDISDTFNLAVQNQAPVIADFDGLPGAANLPYIHDISGFINDGDNDALTVTVEQDGGFALPFWLSFDDATMTFSGDPTTEHTGLYFIRVNVDDGLGGADTHVFSFLIQEFDVTGDESDDLINGTNNADDLAGGGGNDTINGLNGDDQIFGGDGNDSINSGVHHDTVYGGAGNDTVWGWHNNDLILGQAGDDSLHGHWHNDTIYGGEGNDSINGGSQRDTLYGETGNDTIIGEHDVDLVYGGEGDDSINGGTQGDSLYGDIGNDTIMGAHGQDVIYGGEGNDLIDGGTESDTLFGGSGADSLAGGTGADVFEYTSLSETTISETDRITDWEAGVDKIVFNGLGITGIGAGASEITVSNDGSNTFIDHNSSDFRILLEGVHTLGLSDILVAGFMEGTAGADSIDGDAEGNYILGYNGNDTINGGDGDDIIVGGGNSDRIYGDGGNDSIMADDSSSSAPDTVYGGDGNDTIDGGLHHDRLYGDAGDDSIFGNVHNDTIDGGDGNDTLDGGTQRDSISGGLGNDSIIGGQDVDILDGGDGDDTIDGGTSGDRISGGLGNDSIIGGSQEDSIDGGDGDDIIDAGTQNDTIIGGEGFDSISGGAGNDIFIFNTLTSSTSANPDVITDWNSGDMIILNGLGITDIGPGASEITVTDDGVDTFITHNSSTFQIKLNGVHGLVIGDIITGGILSGTTGADSLVGSANVDIIAADNGHDTIEAGAGNDTIYGGGHRDLIYGQDGDDSILGDNLDASGYERDTVYGGAGNDTINVGHHHDLVYGDEGDDSIYGGHHNDTIYGGDGNDTINAYHEYDLVYGGDGDDSIYAGHHDDTVYGEAGNDTIDGAQWADSLSGGEGDDSIHGGDQNDTIEGGAGQDTLSGGNHSDIFIFGDLTHSTSTAADIITDWQAGEQIIFNGIGITGIGGGATEITVSDDGVNTYIDHNSSTFQIVLQGVHSLTDADFSFGGYTDGTAGDDTLTGDATDNYLRGFAGADSITGDAGHDTIEGGDGVDSIYGGDGNDHISGNGNADLIYGNAGDDTIDADNLNNSNTANDTVYGGDGNDSINGGYLHDLIYGDDGNDYLYGNHHNDTLYGGLGNDTLIGWNEHDTLYGGEGNDELSGGNHNDTLVFAEYGLAHVDNITDFETNGNDRIALDNGVFTFASGVLGSGAALTDGVDIFKNAGPNFIGGNFTGGGGATFMYDGSDGQLWYDADGDAGAGTAELVAIIEDFLTYTYEAADFIAWS